LVVAYKKMDQLEYERLLQNIEQARQIIGTERAVCMTRAYNLMENGLTLLGITAVEDRLQDDVLYIYIIYLNIISLISFIKSFFNLLIVTFIKY